ncbi:Bin3-domain-containing protein [Sistotremastrum suecicum HHB10207 ss-3]|uniref:RNA methyltransferase n=1 Tax=Sistotremastrum suecicum HHB10207 ss-3 TaxID=1314776 RepID=A0A166GCM5_9AGAM|nr:Bin3-domain-containing protein [Sistotremastrum suecicum HHB10207 ss-3]
MSAPIHGNYHGYYIKRPSTHDPRLALLPPSFFASKHVLDIGCNEGWVTCEIAQTRRAAKVVGVDIDETLIRAAWKRRRSVWSAQRPQPHTSTSSTTSEAHLPPPPLPPPASNSNSRKKRKRHEEEHEDSSNLDSISDSGPSLANYFPASLEHTFGPIPIPPSSSESQQTQFPHNVLFRTCNWAKEGAFEDKAGYDIVLAFSITKWIHLHGGDEGLLAFFRRVHNVLRRDGKFVLEPQPWEGYAKARKMSPILQENAKTLKLRPDAFAEALRDIGFSEPQKLGSVGEGGFHRPVDVYTKL